MKKFFNMGLRYHLKKSKDTGREKKKPIILPYEWSEGKKKNETPDRALAFSQISIFFLQFSVYIYFKQ